MKLRTVNGWTWPCLSILKTSCRTGWPNFIHHHMYGQTRFLHRYNLSCDSITTKLFGHRASGLIRPSTVRHTTSGLCGSRLIFINAPKQALKPLPPAYSYEDLDRVMAQRKFADISPEQYYDELAPSSDANHEMTRKKIATIIEEYEYAKYTTMRVPSKLTVHNVEVLLLQWSLGHDERIRYLEDLYVVERKAAVRKLRKAEEQKLIDARKEARGKDYEMTDMRYGLWDVEGAPFYGLWHNTMFTRFRKSNIRPKASLTRLRNAALFGQKLIFDFSWEKFMRYAEIVQAMREVTSAYSANRLSFNEPFDLWFCNYRHNSESAKLLRFFLPNLDEYGKHMINLREEHYLDLFPPQNLVYLSPQGKTELTHFSHDDIYIIGALEDGWSPTGRTKIRAKMEGIRSARLPLNLARDWGASSQTVSSVAVTKILVAVKNGISWEEAIKTAIRPTYFKSMDRLVEDERNYVRRSMPKYLRKLKT